MKKLEFPLNALTNSTLTPDQFLICLLIYKKEFKVVKQLVLRLFGYCDHYLGEIYQLLEEDGWVKINGTKIPEDVEVRQKFINLLRDEKLPEVETWVDEYRNLFKGKKIGAIGDRTMCIKHLQWLLSEYPEYTKDDIFKATKYYISTCAKDGYNYLVRAHYFLSKEDSTGTPTHQILTYLEEVKDKDITQSQDFTTEV